MSKAEELKQQGNHFANLSQPHLAIDYYQKAIAETEDPESESAGDKKLLADLYHNIASMYHFTDQNDKAKDYAEKAKAFNEELGRDKQIFGDIYLLCNVLIAQNELNAAEILIQDINYDSDNATLKGRISDIHTKLASEYLKQREFNKSSLFAAEATAMNRELERHDNFFASLFLQCNALLHQDKFADCEALINDLLSCTSEKSQQLLSQTYRDIANYCLDQKQMDKAEHYQALAKQVKIQRDDKE